MSLPLAAVDIADEAIEGCEPDDVGAEQVPGCCTTSEMSLNSRRGIHLKSLACGIDVADSALSRWGTVLSRQLCGKEVPRNQYGANEADA
jgi:hypothetical protein